MTTPFTHHKNNPIIEQASRWVVRLSARDLAPAEREEFEVWLLADVRHSEEFAAQTGLWHAFNDMPADMRAPHIEDAKRGTKQFSWRQGGLMTLAATILLVLILGGWFGARERGWVPLSYETETGKMRRVAFVDGSIAYLNTRTKIQWKGSLTERRVALLDGEALFDVVHDATRPFRIEVGDSDIYVLGTRVNVYRRKDGEVTVTVLDGSVAIHQHAKASTAWQKTLRAKEQLVYGPNGPIESVQTASVEDAVRWQAGILEIRDEPLARVLDELSRYTDQQILFDDPLLARARVAGTLTTRDVRVALATLEKFVPVEVSERDGTFTLTYRTPRTAEEQHRNSTER